MDTYIRFTIILLVLKHIWRTKMNFKGNWFNDFMTFLASYGDIATFITLTLIIATIVLIKRRFLLAIWLPTTVASAGIIGIGKRHHSSFKTLHHLTIDAGFSFPSGHALTSTIVIFALILYLSLN